MLFVCPFCTGMTTASREQLGTKIECAHCHKEFDAPKDCYTPGLIINDFQIEKEIARGGMGIVFQARQLSLDRVVALKILMNKFTEDTEFIKQFIQEARAAAKLNHPNVVQAYMVGEEDGVLFFAMEYIDGLTMKQVLAEEKKIDSLRASKIIYDISEALDFAWNEFKIVHQDIKPDNIMLTSKGKAKLADLGLAKAGEISVLSEDENEVLGTPQYISPEQLLGEKTDVRSDLYSLGATFYHMVVGEFPFVGADANEIARKHVSEKLVPPKEKNSDIPDKVNDIIVKLMEKDINKRYQSASELSKDLRSVIDNFASLKKTPASSEVKTFLPKPPKLTKAPPSIGLKKSEEAPKQEPPKTEAETVEEPKTESPKITGNAPKIGIKKKEEPKKEVPKEAAVKAEDKAEITKKTEKTAGKKDKKDKAKKVKNTEDKKANGAVTAIVVVVIVAALAAVAWWKRDNIMALINKDKAVSEESQSEKVTPPAKKPIVKKPSIPETPKVVRTYLEELQQLKEFIAINPNKENEFLLQFDAFLKKYPAPADIEERKLFAEVEIIYNLLDERLRVVPRREILQKEHLRDIELRESIERQKKIAEEEKRLADARIAEDARRKAEQEAAKLAEEQRIKNEELRIRNEYAAKISPALDIMRELFMKSCRNINQKAELQRFVDNIKNKYPLRDYAIPQEVMVQKEVIDFGKVLLANVAKANEMYRVFEGSTNKFIGLQFNKGAVMSVKATDFAAHNIKVEVLKNGRTYNYNLDKADNRNTLFEKVVEKNKNLQLKELEFYYHLYFDCDKTKMPGMAINNFWKTFFTKSL